MILMAFIMDSGRSSLTYYISFDFTYPKSPPVPVSVENCWVWVLLIDPLIELVASDSFFDSLTPLYELFIFDPFSFFYPFEEFDPLYPAFISLLLLVTIEIWLANDSASNRL